MKKGNLLDPSALKPRKRPQQARSVATVDAIVEAAARILEAGGFDGFSTNAIAHRAGVSVGSLYQYFPSKDAITRALILLQTTALMEDLRSLDDSKSGRWALDEFIRVAVDHQLRRPALARLLDQLETTLPSKPDETAILRDLFDVLRRCLATAGYDSHHDGDTIAADLVAIIKGMVDAAGARGETNATKLTTRVGFAVFGYLEHQKMEQNHRG